MKIYVVSKNSGPSWANEKKTLLYLGPDLEAATAVVGDFVKYRKTKAELNFRYPYLYTILPERVPFKMIEFYEADGWWYSIVQIEVNETNS